MAIKLPFPLVRRAGVDGEELDPAAVQANFDKVALDAGGAGPAGPAGPTGAPGATGAPGPAGVNGQAATIAVGTVTTGAPGSSAIISNSGNSTAAVFDFTIPRGDVGATGSTGTAATVAVGTTTTGSAGSSAAVTNSGSSSAAIFNFTIPRGDTGVQGPVGATGTAATVAVGSTTTGAPGSSASVTNSGTSAAATFDFTIPRGDVGSTGATGPQGPPGSNGNTILSGVGAPSTATGVDGDFYLNTATSELFGPKTAGAWGMGTSLVGPATSNPPGVILPYGAATAPSGYLLCDGASVSTTTYAALYAIIGFTYGGSGSDFVLPDLRGRIPIGKGTHADVDTLGDNDGQTLANRRAGHTHSVPKHKHAVTVTSSGYTDYTDTNHTHGSADGYPFVSGGFAGAGADVSTGGGGYRQQYSGGASAGSNHRHYVNSIGGSGTAGTSTDPSGDSDLTSGASQPSYLTINYIIKT